MGFWGAGVGGLGGGWAVGFNWGERLKGGGAVGTDSCTPKGDTQD